MKAAQARRLANNVIAGKIKPKVRTTELDEVLRLIGIEAGIGSMFMWLEADMILDEDTHAQLFKLGYSVTYVQSRPTARPKWRVGWERKAA